MGRTNRSRAVGSAASASGRFTIGPDRRIIEWDDAAARLLGIPRDAALGIPCERVLGGRNDFGHALCGPACPASRALADGSITGTSHMLTRAADGTRLRLACDLTALPSGGALGRLRGVYDATCDLAYDLAGVAALTARASREPLQQGLQHALDFLLHATAADAGEVFLVEPHGKGLVRTCHRGRFGRAFDQLLRFDPGMGFPGLVLSHGQPVYTDHLSEDPRFLRTQVKREGFNTYLCTPLTSRSDTLGCIALAFRRADIDLARVLDLLRWIGPLLGLVIDAALTRLQQSAKLLLQGVEGDPERRLPRALHTLLQEMVRVTSADCGEMCLPWHASQLRRLVAGGGGVPCCPVLSADTIARCPAFEVGTPRLLRGRRATWPLACRDAPHPGGAWCCTPLACDGESLGVIRLCYRHLRPVSPGANIAVLERLASLAAEKVRDMREQLARACGPEPLLHVQLQSGAGTPAASGVRATRRAVPGHTGELHGSVRLEIRCLGPLELAVDGAWVAPATIRRKRVLALLGILLTHHDQSQCKDALIERLWPGADPFVRTRQFHVLVHELRKLLDPHGRSSKRTFVCNQADHYVFITQPSCWIDSLEFHALLEFGRKAETAREERAAIGAYEAAAELYRGDYLQDQPFAEWCWPTREQLREACLGALNRLSTLWGGQGRWDKSIAWSRRALLIDPLHEEMHRALMYALWASGRRSEAVRQYEACAHLLREQLDLAPLPETEHLVTRIRATPRPHCAY